MEFIVVKKVINHLWRRVSGRHPMAQVTDVSGKIAVVTGAGIGSIGYVTAKTLAAWGATVVITTRSQPEKTRDKIREELRRENIQANIDCCELDLTSAQSVVDFARWFNRHHGDQLDILVNNAGVHLDILSEWKEPLLLADGYETQYRTNYLGAFHLTEVLMPYLKKAGQQHREARVVNVVSHLHEKGVNDAFFSAKLPYNSWQAYGQSKLALIHHAFEIERQFAEEFHVHGYAVHPGSIYTNIAYHGLQGHKLLQQLRGAFAFLEKRILLTPEQGAQTQIYCATNANAEGGRYYTMCQPVKPSDDALDSVVAKRLWKQTREWVDSLKVHTPT